MDNGEQTREPGAIIGYSRAVETAVGAGRNFFGRPRGKDRIEMSRNGDVRAGSVRSQESDDVARRIDRRLAAQGAKLLEKPFSALLLEERRRGDPAEGEVLFILNSAVNPPEVGWRS